ncbi:hypothetical protein M8J76_015728 [Diaphorina citri]|nr:hypothetical protein M8J76_015728 [Diaphorina citri]
MSNQVKSVVTPNVLVVQIPIHPWVERDKLRERDRQARAQMSSQAERECEVFSAPLFEVPVRVNLCDQVTRQIQSTLGNYEEVKHLLGSAHDSIYGIDGHPPPSPAPATTRTPVSRSTTTPPVSRSAVLTSGGGPEFKKPTRSSMPTSSSSSSNNNHRDHHHPSSTQR